MLKMIIVDDEPDMLEGIVNHLPFDKLGITICGISQNGLDGLKSINELRPDIILCDISMPRMSGFEMLEKIRTISDYRPQVIMLTGHDDFTHAQKAIKYQVMDYLVKPVMPDEVLAAITRARDLCVKDKLSSSRSQTGLDSLKMSFIETLLGENTFTEEDLKQKQLELNIPLTASAYLCISLFIRNYDHMCRQVTHEQITEMKSEIISEFSDAFEGCHFTHFNGDSIKFLVLSDKHEEYSDIIKKCSLILNSSPTSKHTFICVSRFGFSVSELPEIAKQAEYCRKFAFCFQTGTVLTYDTISSYMKKSFEKGSFLLLEDDVKDLRIKNIIEWHSSIDKLKATLDSFEYYDPAYIKTVIYQAMNSILSNMLPDHASQSSSDEQNSLWDNISDTHSIDELFELCHGIANEFKDIADASTSQRSLLLSEQMKQYVRDNYMHQITVVALSKHFYLSPNYMRQLFLSVNGITFKNYLKQYRMEKAKELLTSGKYKIYEVAIGVGYNDIKSFRSAFTEYFGISPSGMISQQ